MKNLLRIAMAWSLFTGSAYAQSTPDFRPNQLPTAVQWKSYFSGKVDVFGGVLNSPTINGGTFNNPNITNLHLTSIDGTPIGPITPSTGAFTTLSATSLSLGSLDSTPIGSTTPSTGAFTTLTATSFSTSALNSTPIGATTPSTGAFTTLSASGNGAFGNHTTFGLAGQNVLLVQTAASSSNTVLSLSGTGSLEFDIPAWSLGTSGTNALNITPGGTGASAIAITQNGTGGISMSPALTLTAPGTALNMTNNATIGGILTTGTVTANLISSQFRTNTISGGTLPQVVTVGSNYTGTLTGTGYKSAFSWTLPSVSLDTSGQANGFWEGVMTQNFGGTKSSIGGLRLSMTQTSDALDPGANFFLNPLSVYLDLQHSGANALYSNGIAAASEVNMGASATNWGLVEAHEYTISMAAGASASRLYTLTVLNNNLSGSHASLAEAGIAFGGKKSDSSVGWNTLIALSRGDDEWPTLSTGAIFKAYQQSDHTGATIVPPNQADYFLDASNINFSHIALAPGLDLQEGSAFVGNLGLTTGSNGPLIDTAGLYKATACAVSVAGASYVANDQVYPSGIPGVIQIDTVNGSGNVTACHWLKPAYNASNPTTIATTGGSGNGAFVASVPWALQNEMDLGTVTATAIAIGNSGSTTTLNGTVNLGSLGPIVAYSGVWVPGDCVQQSSTANQLIDTSCSSGSITGSGSTNQLAVWTSPSSVGGITLGNTLAVSGGTINLVQTISSHVSSHTIDNIGGTDTYSSSSPLTATVPAFTSFGSGATFILNNEGTGALTIDGTTNSIPFAGIPTSGGNGHLDQFGFAFCTSDGTTCHGGQFTGYVGTITANSLVGFADAFGGFKSVDLTGDATTSGSAVTTVAKINGTSVPTNSAADQALITTASATGAWKALTNCNGANSAVTYSTSTHAFGCNTLGTGGTVTTTGTPASGNLAVFSGSLSITNGNLSGDVTTSGTLASTVVALNGTSVPTNSAADQAIVTVSAATGAWKALPSCSGTLSSLTYNTSTHAYGCNTASGANIQIFCVSGEGPGCGGSGTWTYNAGYTFVDVEVCGGGGGGGGGILTASGTANSGGAGGGGGGCNEQVFRASDIGANQTVTLGTGGAGGVGNNNGSPGGNTTFGSFLTGYGGGGGGKGLSAANATAGAGGGLFANGSTAAGTNSAQSGCGAVAAGAVDFGGASNTIVVGAASRPCSPLAGAGGAPGQNANNSFAGAQSYYGGAGGGPGSGVSAGPGAFSGSQGGTSLGCQTAPAVGAVNGGIGGNATVTYIYQSGCGGSGGGSSASNSISGGKGGNGIHAGGGAGGGSSLSGGSAVAGNGGNGGGGYVVVRSW